MQNAIPRLAHISRFSRCGTYPLRDSRCRRSYRLVPVMHTTACSHAAQSLHRPNIIIFCVRE
jgi:hypothetical protein